MNSPCPNCKKTNSKFVDKYKFNVLYDEIFFKNIDIFNCKECDLSFATPMPKESDLNEYYSSVYRAKNRPHNILEATPVKALQARLKLLEENVDFSKVKNVLEVGAGGGDFGYFLKKKFKLSIYTIEPDEYSRSILPSKGYLNFDDKNLKFDLIYSTHVLEHFNDVDAFFKIFENNLSEKCAVFTEVPNNSLETWFNERPYDSPHTLFFSKNSLEKVFLMRNYKIIFSDYVGDDIKTTFKLMEKSKKKFEKWQPNKIYLRTNLKRILKKIIPSFILSLRLIVINFLNKSHFKEFEYGDKNSWCLRIIVKK